MSVQRLRVGTAFALLVAAASLGGIGTPASESIDSLPLEATIEIRPLEATVGDRISATIALTVPAGTRLDPPEFGPQLGRFSVLDGSWSGPESSEAGDRWVWSGALVTFRPGDAEIPAVSIVVEDDEGGRREARTEPVPVSIISVLEPAEPGSEPEISDLKPPASIPPDYSALTTAAGILGLLLLAAAILWWLHRRYAARLAAVPAPADPFHRTPPDEWVYAELQRLLEQRLAEHGEVERFFAELAQVMKTYLGGRFRIELLQQTTEEVPRRLQQAGAAEEAIDAIVALLDSCDHVKFARRRPGSDDCRGAIESAYRIVDATKPRRPEVQPAVQGAA